MRPLEEELKGRIHEKGRITFAEFVELALYWPNGGYYSSTARVVGPTGDFYTSPVAHPAFGACLALQLQQMWSAMGRPHPFYVVEPGAGDGLLCRDIVTYLDRVQADLLAALRYVMLDRSAGPGLEQGLPPALLRHVERLRSEGMPSAPFQGCVLANELLDAFPVHRVSMKGGRLQEVYVTLGEANQFIEVMGDLSTTELEERFRELNIRLPEGHRTEVNLGLRTWVSEVAQSLERGFVLVVDYGHPAEALYDTERARGTLRCYYKHTLNADPYQRVGRQDISVHVDFTTLAREAGRAGLSTLGFTTQGPFLVNLGLGAFLRAVDTADLPLQQRRANEMGMEELVRRDGLGAFRVLALAKGVGSPCLHGLNEGNPLRRRLEKDPRGVALPLATRDHMPFGRSPGEPETLPPWDELVK